MGDVVKDADADALALIDELRKRGAIEVEVPRYVRLDSDRNYTTVPIRAKFATVDPRALPAAAPAQKPPTPEEQAAQDEETLFASV